MNIEIAPISVLEEKKLRTVLYTRLAFGVFLLFPMLVMLGIVVSDLLSNSSSVWAMLIGLILGLFMVLGIVKFLIPFYLKSFRNLKAKHKLIVTSYVSKVNKKWTRYGFSYIVVTDYMVIDSWINSILIHNLSYNDLFPGMTIKIHHLENNEMDILQLTCQND
jgi:hypothetical protein